MTYHYVGAWERHMENLALEQELRADGTWELLEAVDELAKAMKARILENRHRSPLAECSYIYLLEKIRENMNELESSIRVGRLDPDDLQHAHRHAADAANFGMLCWVKARREVLARQRTATGEQPHE